MDTETKKLRHALGQFATGVAIVTTRDNTGNNVGLTINSFTSISLEPPLVSWSLANGANSLGVFKHADKFAIHVLHSGQESLSQRFAKKGTEKFSGIPLDASEFSIPLFSDFVSRFICQKYCSIRLGDHVVFVGQIKQYHTKAGKPLIFAKGQYASVDFASEMA